MSSSPSPRQRISDADRQDALEALGVAFREGRLDVGEYDHRCQEIMESVYESDLAEVFIDIPRYLPGSDFQPRQASGGAACPPERLYTRAEVQQAHVSGARKRFGTFCLILILTIMASFAAQTFMTLFAIPTAFVGLYVLRWGPKSWNVLSPHAMDRQERRQLRMAERRKALERKAARREATQEIADSAMRWANDALNRKK